MRKEMDEEKKKAERETILKEKRTRKQQEEKMACLSESVGRPVKEERSRGGWIGQG